MIWRFIFFLFSPEKETTPPRAERPTLESLNRIEGDLDEMARKADAAYAIMKSSKTVEIRPKDEPKTPPKSNGTTFTNKSKKSNGTAPPKVPDKDDEAAWAAENQRLADEIAAAQAVLAMLKPDVKPGSKQP